MKNLKTKIIIILLIVLMLLIVLCIGFMIKPKEKNNEIIDLPNDIESSKLDEKEKKNEIGLESVKMIGDIEVSNMKIVLVEDDKCEFLSDVKNTSDKFQEATSLRIKIIDNSGKVDEIFAGTITELTAFETNKFKAIVLADITDVVDVEFEIIK